MSLVRASRIAMYIALIRSIESNRPQNKRLFYDPFAKDFLPPALGLVERLSRVSFLNRFAAWYIERGWPGAYTAVTARTRLIDVMCINSIKDHGLNQVFILGAGFDCRAHRLPIREKVQFVEVDHPHTQLYKQELLAKLKEQGVPVAHVDYFAIDLTKHKPQEVIPGQLKRPHYRTLVIWESVTNDLTAGLGSKVFGYLMGFPPGTRIIFTYVDKKMLDDPASWTGADIITRLLKKHREFWNNGMYPDEVRSFLESYGMELVYDEGAARYRSLCFGEKRATGMKGYEFYRVAMAKVK
jgi:methyltransferase (TIGR00027 family)